MNIEIGSSLSGGPEPVSMAAVVVAVVVVVAAVVEHVVSCYELCDNEVELEDRRGNSMVLDGNGWFNRLKLN